MSSADQPSSLIPSFMRGWWTGNWPKLSSCSPSSLITSSVLCWTNSYCTFSLKAFQTMYEGQLHYGGQFYTEILPTSPHLYCDILDGVFNYQQDILLNYNSCCRFIEGEWMDEFIVISDLRYWLYSILLITDTDINWYMPVWNKHIVIHLYCDVPNDGVS